MKKVAIAAALAMVLDVAQAGTDKDSGEVCQGSTCNGGGGTTNSNTTQNFNNNNPRAYGGDARASASGGDATAYGGRGGTGVGIGVGGQGGDARSNSGSNASNSLTINTPGKTVSLVSTESKSKSEFRGEYRYEYEGKLHNTPSMAIGTPDATAPCYVGLGGNVAVAGFGVGAAGSIYDQDCADREVIRLGQSSRSPEIRAKADYALGMQLDEVIKRQEDEKEETVASGSYSSSEGVFALTNY